MPGSSDTGESVGAFIAKYLSWPALAAAAWQMTIDGHYVWAYRLFAVAGVGAIWAWRTSTFLKDRRPERLPIPDCADPEKFAAARRRWGSWVHGGTAAIVFAAAACLSWTYWEHRTAALLETAGLLIPASDPTPNACSEYPLPTHVVALYMGGGRYHAEAFPYEAITQQDGTPIISIDRDAERRVGVTVDVESSDGNIVVQIKQNRFRVNPNNYLSMDRPDRSTLVVTDQQGTEVLNLRYLNSTAMQLTGTLHYGEGKKVVISRDAMLAGRADETVIGMRGACSSYSARQLSSTYLVP